ncbi:MAG: MBG domain-containing protein, partial [Eggerthella lenta]
AGMAHSAAVTNDGTAYAWGNGREGALGTSSTQNVYSPKKMVNATGPYGMHDVVCGASFTSVMRASMMSDAFFAKSGYSATDAGTYTVVVKPRPNYCWSDGTTGERSLDWSITRKSVDAAAEEGLVYDGSEQQGVVPGEGYTLSGQVTATNAGTYTATATLVSENYVWADGTSEPKVIEWSIASQPIADEEVVVSGLVYNGTSQTGVNSSDKWGVSGVMDGIDAGSYPVDVIPASNYCWSDGSEGKRSFTWDIAPAPLTAAYVSETVAWNGTPVLAVEVTGFVNGETAETAADYVAPHVVAPDSLTEGSSYELTPEGGSAKNYSFEYVSGTLKVGLTPANIERIAGDYANQTSALISSEAFASSDWVVLARDDDFADAMSATGLAGALN